VFWFLFATVTPLTFMAMIGILILMGVVVNNGIVLVAHIAQLRAAGMERTAAIIQAGRDRLRPIPHDHSHDAAGDAAARDRRCAGRRWQQWRAGVLPDGARDHRRSRLLDDRVAADRAIDVRVARQCGTLDAKSGKSRCSPAYCRRDWYRSQ
jgi:hypothetical protein